MAVGIPNFPTSLDAASDLVEATNNASTTINMVGGLSNSATTITVVSTAAFPSTGIVRIDDELISYSANSTAGATSNSNAITFPQASGTWGTVVALGIFDASTSGNLLAWADLTTSKLVGNGDTPSFAAGDLDVTLD
jgi:hypothetical protein